MPWLVSICIPTQERGNEGWGVTPFFLVPVLYVGTHTLV